MRRVPSLFLQLPLSAARSARRADAGVCLPRGLTLVELMVVVAILSLLSLLAAPSFVAAIERYRVNTTIEELQSALTVARIEAIRRGGNVRLERMSGGDCPTLAAAQHWSCGWRIWAQAGGSDTLVREFRATRGVSITFSVAANNVTLDRWGRPGNLGVIGFTVSPESNAASLATATLCQSSGGRLRSVQGSVTC